MLLPQYPDIKVEINSDKYLVDIVEQRYDAGVRLGEHSKRYDRGAHQSECANDHRRRSFVHHEATAAQDATGSGPIISASIFVCRH